MTTKTKILRFFGGSDDILSWTCLKPKGQPKEQDEESRFMKPIAFTIASGEGALTVVGHYAPAGTAGWCIGIQQVDEDAPLPNWPVSFDVCETPYSPTLEITVPADATVTVVKEPRK